MISCKNRETSLVYSLKFYQRESFLLQQLIFIILMVNNMKLKLVGILMTFARCFWETNFTYIHVYIGNLIICVYTILSVLSFHFDILFMVEASVMSFNSFSFVIVKVNWYLILNKTSHLPACNMIMWELNIFYHIINFDLNIFSFPAC